MDAASLHRARAAAFGCLLLAAAAPALAAPDTDGMLRQAAETRTTVVSSTGGQKLSAVFLDTNGNCSFAALVHARGEVENFSVCAGAVTKRNVSPPPWPDTAASREFRERVVYLALLYRASTGIDPDGFKIRARLTDASADACKIAEVATMADNALVRLDLVPACPH
jgi:hypothetical protein